MRRGTSNLTWREVRPGLGLLLGLVAVAVAVFFFDEAQRAAEEGPRLVVVTESAPGLEPGSAVWVAGRPAGRVLSVQFRDPMPGGRANIVIDAAMNRGVGRIMRKDATARILSSSLLAPIVLSIRPGSPGFPRYDFRDTLRSTVSLIDQDRTLALLDSLGKTIEATRPLARRFQREVREGPGTLAALRRDTTVLLNFQDRLSRLRRLLAPEGEGSLTRLMRDTSIASSLEHAESSLRRLSGTLDSLEYVGSNLAGLLDVVIAIQDRLGRIQENSERGYGSVARAFHDTAVIHQRQLLMARLDSARAEIVANAFHYIRFRLF